jgi:hypothetical protein
MKKDMKKNIFTFLATMLLLSACGNAPAPIPTPSGLEERPTPTVAYQIIGSTKYTAMVVVDPASNTDRAGLLEIGDYLCAEHEKCKVWFWDDINKADATYPIDPENEQYLIAYYKFDWQVYASEIKVYTLGDPR